jgi:adenosylcobyric acid synthase
MEDAAWLGRSGWKKAIREFAHNGGRVFGICGGYQLLGERIRDPLGVESGKKSVSGLGLLPVETVLEKEKVVRRVNGVTLTNKRGIRGYEIHMGRSRILRGSGKPFLKIHLPGKRSSWEDGCYINHGEIAGSYVHGILDSPGFRGDLLNRLRKSKGLRERPAKKGRLARFHQYDRLADHLENHCDVDQIISHIRN